MKALKFLTLFLFLSPFYLKAQQNIQVGDIYTFDDNTKGVVFYVNEDGNGLAVSTQQEKRKWEEESHYVYCQDIASITNELLPSLDINIGLGKTNTAFIIGQLKDGKPIAAKYSREEGSEWYLPSAGELYQLMVANADDSINKILKENGYKEIQGWYWTSSEYGHGEVWCTNHHGKNKRCSKLSLKVNARAIRMF